MKKQKQTTVRGLISPLEPACSADRKEAEGIDIEDLRNKTTKIDIDNLY